MDFTISADYDKYHSYPQEDSDRPLRIACTKRRALVRGKRLRGWGWGAVKSDRPYDDDF